MWIRNDNYRKLAPEGEGGGAGGEGEGEGAGEGAGAGAGAGDGGQGEGGAGDGGAGGGQAGPAGFPEDWRLQMAGGDEKRAARLERFTDPAAVGASFFEKDQRISAGDLLKPLPEDATEEDVKAYREQQGIPAEASGYLDSVEGLVIGEDDKPLFGSYAEAMHAANVPPQHVKAGLEWYNAMLDEQQGKATEMDADDKNSYEDAMREEWGSDFRVNQNVANSTLDASFDEETANLLRTSRGADGTLLMNNPGFMRGIVAMGRMINPASTVLPAGQADMNGLQERKTEIEKFMSTNRDEYFKDQGMQDEYRQILEAEEKMNKQKSAA